MSKTWAGLERQHNKIRAALEKITPPVPSDEYEESRRTLLAQMDRTDAYIHGQVTGEGSMSIPDAVGE